MWGKYVKLLLMGVCYVRMGICYETLNKQTKDQHCAHTLIDTGLEIENGKGHTGRQLKANYVQNRKKK